MGFFDRWLQRKASGFGRFIALMAYGQPVWTPRDYEGFAKEGYQANPWVYASIRQITQACAGINWLLYQGPRANRRGKVKEIDIHPLLDLLNKPNPEMGKAAFLENVIGFLELSGNTYIEKVTVRGGEPRELWPIRPDRMKVLPDLQNRIGGYRYTIGGYEKDWTRDSHGNLDVMHHKLWHPTDDWYGMSPIEAAGRVIDADNASNTYQYALYKNEARPGGILSVEGSLTNEQRANLKSDLVENYAGGADRWGRPMVLEGGMKWTAMGLSPRDMSIIEQGNWDAQKICTVFGVAGELVGLKNATYENRREAKKALYTEVVLPLMDALRDDFNNWLVPYYGDRLYLDYDRDAIDALQEDREKLWMRVGNASWLTVNEKRQAVGYDEIDDGDVILVPATQMPLSEVIAPQPSEEPAPVKGIKAFNLSTDEQKQNEWKRTDKVRIAWEKQWASQIKRRFDAERKAVVKAVEDGNKSPEINQKAWETTYKALYLATAEDFGERTLEGLKADGATFEHKSLWELFGREVSKVIGEVVARQVKLITDTTQEQIQKEILSGLDADEDFPTLAKRIESLYLDGIIPNRSMVIARTEVLTASSLGSRYAAKELGADVTKEWVATPDNRCRTAHREANGQKRGIDEMYSIGGAGMMYPGDPSGGAKNVVQCRCMEIYHTKEGQ